MLQSTGLTECPQDLSSSYWGIFVSGINQYNAVDKINVHFHHSSYTSTLLEAKVSDH